MTASNSFEYYCHSDMENKKLSLTQEQYNTLKEIYVERMVDNMSTKDLVQYVTDDMSQWVDSLTYNDAMVEFQEYWDEYFTDTIQEVLEIHPNEERHPYLDSLSEGKDVREQLLEEGFVPHDTDTNEK